MKLSQPLVGLGGKLRSGKDEVADRLSLYDFVKLGMSDALHEAMLKIDPYVPVEIELGKLQRWLMRVIFRRDETVFDFERYSSICARVGYVEAKTNPEVRRLLQKLGTDVGRNMIGENVWVNIMARKIDDHRGAGHPVVVTGVRFRNEVAMIEELGGRAVWVDRPGIQAPTEGTAAHASENSVSEGDFSVTLLNDSTLESLRLKVDDLARSL